MTRNEYLNLKTFRYTDGKESVIKNLNWCNDGGVWTVEESPFYPDEFICRNDTQTWVAVKYNNTTQLFADIMNPLKLSITARFAVCDYLVNLEIYAMRSGVTDLNTLALLFKKAAQKEDFKRLASLQDNFSTPVNVEYPYL